jgi:hypothetical protein
MKPKFVNLEFLPAPAQITNKQKEADYEQTERRGADEHRSRRGPPSRRRRRSEAEEAPGWATLQPGAAYCANSKHGWSNPVPT